MQLQEALRCYYFFQSLASLNKQEGWAMRDWEKEKEKSQE